VKKRMAEGVGPGKLAADLGAKIPDLNFDV
jgi:hypothetical protein